MEHEFNTLASSGIQIQILISLSSITLLKFHLCSQYCTHILDQCNEPRENESSAQLVPFTVLICSYPHFIEYFFSIQYCYSDQ